MFNPLASKLERFARLSVDERAMLDALACGRGRQISARQHVIREGERSAHVDLIVDGWAHCYRVLANGRRQIVAFLVPGDLCDRHACLAGKADHSIVAVTSLRVAQISREDFDSLAGPRLAQALRWDALVNAAIQREWTVSIGQRSALERVAHLILELFYRIRSVGLTDGNGFEFPLRQTELADALGLTPVHTNRTLKALRGDGLIQLNERCLVIPDLAALERLAMFNANYLHLGHEGQHPDGHD